MAIGAVFTSMFKRACFFLILVVLATRAMAEGFTTVDVPGALQTGVSGISGSTLTGSFQDAGGFHGFIKSAGTYTTLDAPWAPLGSTYAQGIDGQTVVGHYELPAPPPDPNGFGSNVGLNHGFIETGGVYTKLDVPGATDTFPQGISGNIIVGSCATATGAHAFVDNDGVFTIFDHPLATSGTSAAGIFGSTIVGT